MRRGPNVDAIEITVRPARPPEGERLREIAITSKSTWGYDLDRVRRWAALGDFSDEGLRKKEFYVADAEGEAVGWAPLTPKGEVCWLDDLWIDPAWMGRGLGTLLFQHAVARARQVGAVSASSGRPKDIQVASTRRWAVATCATANRGCGAGLTRL